MKKLFLTFTFITFCLLSVNAQSKTGTLTDMSFLEGHWRGTFNGGPIDAVWIAPAGDNLTGFIRMMKDNKVTMYEMLIFEQTDNGPIALVKHFKPGLIGQEEKDKQDRYKFLEAKKDYALYEKEDGSIRIIYEKRSKDQLVIQRGQSKDGKWAFSDLFVFNRVRN
ncbi:hypothetical protein GCM10028806_47240 [Spirosoma terrae]|uniref:DUF6265 domain-containing protein n=1 Tax=Spirosoma terrae TaxID=1968276 RepID=A0A6L9L3C5_9BACT|nr:DUF6265 family protein [Spirosoma terrae]NDU93611.1 hypothetical protein [Spirosoma terrae]